MLNCGTNGLAELDNSRSLIGLQKDRPHFQALSQHLVLGLEQLDVPDQLVAAAPGDKEEQGLENPFHGDILQELRC
jgi:hypothetical protein